ncbi:hypothetical protein PHYSODRAFT_503930, partial [Phytophthora sojae]
CGTVRKQARGTGYSNLLNHVRKEHPDYATTMAASARSGALTSFVDSKSQTVYNWLDLRVECNLPFSFPENATVRKSICTETFLKYMRLVCGEVEKDVAEALPAKFDIVFDGCTFKSEQYVGVFAVFPHDNRAETVLLAMAPIVDDEVKDHTAESHVAFLSTVLGFFNRTTNDIIYVVGDNCSTNGKVSTLLGVPLVGCASHRLNLAVTAFMGKHEKELEKLQMLMRKLRTLNAAAWLR